MTEKEKIIFEIEQESKKQGLSESALAKKAGLGQKRVNNLLSGKTQRLDYAVVDKLRGALGIVAQPDEDYKSTRPNFRVVEEICPETKKPTTPVVQGIIGIVEAMTPEQQIQAFKALSELFTASHQTEKP